MCRTSGPAPAAGPAKASGSGTASGPPKASGSGHSLKVIVRLKGANQGANQDPKAKQGPAQREKGKDSGAKGAKGASKDHGGKGVFPLHRLLATRLPIRFFVFRGSADANRSAATEDAIAVMTNYF